MVTVDYLTLISGRPFQMKGFTVYPPVLQEIVDIGYSEYESYLSVFLLSVSNMSRIAGLEDGDLPSSITALQLLTYIPELRAALLRALSFFMHCDVQYAADIGYFIESDGSVSYLSLEQLREVRSVILQLCNVQDDVEPAPVKFKNEKAKRTYEKIHAKKAAQQKAARASSASLGMTLPNLISAVAAFSPTYNLLNIWQMTVYQLYDQFARLNDHLQLNVFGQRWAAWGTENFDFSVWYRPLYKNP